MYTLEQLQPAIEASWDIETAFPDGSWSPQNPARAQCVVTALVIQHFMGGELQKLTTIYNGAEESHYRNVLSGGEIVDLTGSQYPVEQKMDVSSANLHGFASVREKMMHEQDTRQRYELLLRRVMRRLGEAT